ncbi:MAG TPA: hypothetical protein DEB17_10690 [Chlorobaculum sp.]|jgi:ElaB/YqjD/DUF883 family membrane-anchored ribosome-binding protein|uniref:DUF883 domain-containing protein n=1 Tax=Chlorobaculum tepidum (strain ATCC 49652 / DSM 12025 / NBRC 103806 / TLS) TaxID=194439 RepID=Q8KBL9_CHLTE|nr:hypothetical protein [Chlorobaculum tepidum]AAM72988.1 hypothetical protein CT1767 [Chlorobaculum tepidum TLS]HBU24434.1 hypothetical protein [Chlorobaculum sp.]
MEHQIPVNDTSQEQPKTGPAVHDEIPEPFRKISQKVSEAFSEFKESETWEKMLDARDKARDYITENPVNSFFYALGAGMFLGFLLKRK